MNIVVKSAIHPCVGKAFINSSRNRRRSAAKKAEEHKARRSCEKRRIRTYRDSKRSRRKTVPQQRPSGAVVRDAIKRLAKACADPSKTHHRVNGSRPRWTYRDPLKVGPSTFACKSS